MDHKGLPYLYECDTWYESETSESEQSDEEIPIDEVDLTCATYGGYTMEMIEDMKNYVRMTGEEHDNVNIFHIGTFMDRRTCPDNTTLVSLESFDDGICVTFVSHGAVDRTMSVTISRKRLRKLMRKNLKKYIPQ